MKKLLIIWGIIIIIAAIFISHSKITANVIQEQADQPIKIAINVWPGYAHAFIAQEKGFFKQQGVDVELILTKDYFEAQELYKLGKVDGIFEVYPDAIFHNFREIPTKVVYIADYSNEADVLISSPEIDSVSKLNGKNIGIDGINTFSHLFVLEILKNAGLDETHIMLEKIPASEVIAAIEDGRISAGHTWEPAKSEGIAKGFNILAEANDAPGIITDILSFNEEFLKERPDDCRKVVKALFQARDFIYSNSEEAHLIMAEAENLSIEEVKSGLKEVIQPDMAQNHEALDKDKSNSDTSLYKAGEKIIDFYLRRGQISYKPNLDEILYAGCL